MKAIAAYEKWDNMGKELGSNLDVLVTGDNEKMETRLREQSEKLNPIQYSTAKSKFSMYLERSL